MRKLINKVRDFIQRFRNKNRDPFIYK